MTHTNANGILQYRGFLLPFKADANAIPPKIPATIKQRIKNARNPMS